MRLIKIHDGVAWRSDAHRVYYFTTYRVPVDMPAETADRAIAEGVAVEVSALETKPAPAVPERKVVRRSAPKE